MAVVIAAFAMVMDVMEVEQIAPQRQELGVVDHRGASAKMRSSTTLATKTV